MELDRYRVIFESLGSEAGVGGWLGNHVVGPQGTLRRSLQKEVVTTTVMSLEYTPHPPHMTSYPCIVHGCAWTIYEDPWIISSHC